MKTAILKPGLLVSLNTTLTGAVQYQRREIEPDHDTDEGGRAAKWETARYIPDAAEHDQAVKVRSKCRSLIVGVCSSSSFGLLCPASKEAELAAALEVARATADAFNAQAASARVGVFVLIGRIANDEVEAARAIGSEVRELLDAMRAGIKAADPEAIREAANRARELGAMLSDDVAAKVSEAVEQARTAARVIVKRVQKSGELAADVVAELSVRRIELARFAFLDLEEGRAEAIAPAGRALDLSPEAPPAPRPQSALPFALEV